MTFDEVFEEPSDKERILDKLDEMSDERPYNYMPCNRAWLDAIEEITAFIEKM